MPAGDDPRNVIKRYATAAVAALAVTAAVTPAPAASQGITSPYDFVESSMGIWAFGSAVLTDRGTLDIGPGSGYAAGLGYTIRVSGPFNFDARAAYMPTSRRVFNVLSADSAEVREDPRVGLEQLGTADLDLLLLDTSLRFDLTGPRTWNQLQPYAVVGAGVALRIRSDEGAEELLPEDNDDLRVEFESGVTGHAGAGVEWYVSDRFSVRADARDLFWKIHVPRGFFVDGRVVAEEQWVQTAHLSLGAVYRF